MRWDGTDEKAHLKVSGVTTFPANPADDHEAHGLLVPSMTEPKPKPSTASLIKMAPAGDLALAKINNEIYANKQKAPTFDWTAGAPLGVPGMQEELRGLAHMGNYKVWAITGNFGRCELVD